MLSKINIKLGLTLIIVLFAISLASVSLFSLTSLTHSKNSIMKVDVIQGDQIIPLLEIYSKLQSARLVAQKIRNSLQENPTLEVDKLLQRQDEYITSAAQEMNALNLVNPLTLEGKKFRSDIEIAYAAYMGEGITPMQQALKNKDIEAYKKILTSLSSQGENFQKKIETFTSFAQNLGNKEVSNAEHNFNVNFIVISSLLSISAFIIVASLFLINAVILSPINDARRCFSNIEKGDLSTIIPLQPNTEMGGLLTSLSNMQDSLKELVSSIRESSSTIAVGTRQLSAGNQDFSSRTEEQAASIVQTAASMDELTSSVQQNTANTHNATIITNSMTELAEKNNQNINRIITRIEAIRDSAADITNILVVIDGIAFQTNILALNAAVEAARAGDAGKGFAVVASEVRGLAQRSAASAKEIKKVIETSGEKIRQGTYIAQSSKEDMELLLNEVIKTREIINEIALASEEQSQGIEQVNKAVNQLELVAQQNAALVEESAAATDSVADQANSLEEVIQFFKLK